MEVALLWFLTNRMPGLSGPSCPVCFCLWTVSFGCTCVETSINIFLGGLSHVQVILVFSQCWRLSFPLDAAVNSSPCSQGLSIQLMSKGRLCCSPCSLILHLVLRCNFLPANQMQYVRWPNRYSGFLAVANLAPVLPPAVIGTEDILCIHLFLQYAGSCSLREWFPFGFIKHFPKSKAISGNPQHLQPLCLDDLRVTAANCLCTVSRVLQKAEEMG